MVTQPVVMEVIAGARSEARERDLRRLMLSFGLLPFDAAVDFDGAAHLYRACRSSGATPRGMVDCMIAAVARRHGASLLAKDRDLEKVAALAGIELNVV